MHARCQSLLTEDDVEQAADEGFDCVSCQPYVVKPVGEYQLLGGQGRDKVWVLGFRTVPKMPAWFFPPQCLLPLQSWCL